MVVVVGGTWVGCLLVVSGVEFVLVVVVGCIGGWLFLAELLLEGCGGGGGCMWAGGCGSGGWCGSVLVVVSFVTCNVTGLVTGLVADSDMVGSSPPPTDASVCPPSTINVLLLLASSCGPTFSLLIIIAHLLDVLMVKNILGRLLFDHKNVPFGCTCLEIFFFLFSCDSSSIPDNVCLSVGPCQRVSKFGSE